MKNLAVLFLLVVTGGVAALWHNPSEPVFVPKATTEPAVADAAHKPTPRSTIPRPVQAGTLSRLPKSYAGTQVDGRFQTDPSGNLIINDDIRRVFDYFLTAIGEESIATSVTRLRHYIEQQLPQPAEHQALRILSQYLEYKRQLLVLEKAHAQRADLDALRERLEAVRQLRIGIFNDAVYKTFFALDEAADNFTLERLAIRRNPNLDPSTKGAAIDGLQSSLPAELLDSLVPQLQSELRQQTQLLTANGGTPEELRQLRQHLVGSAATERLERLDRERQRWQQRLAAYREDKARIENSRGLGVTDKRQAIARLAAARFDATERQRLEAAEQLLATKNN